MYTNHLIDAILDTPVTREMYLRRVRTLMDEYLGTEPGYFEDRAAELLALIAPDAALDGAKWGMASAAAGIEANLAYRRTELGAEPLIPPSDLPSVAFSTAFPSPGVSRTRLPTTTRTSPRRRWGPASGSSSCATRPRSPSVTEPRA